MEVTAELKAAEVAVEKAVEGTVNTVEAEAKTVASEVVKETKEVVAEVKGDVAKVEVKTEEKAKAAVVDISTDEKLFLREAELEYLKAQMEIQRLTKITEGKSTQYQAFIEGLLKKYTLDKAEYVFDAAVNAFRKL